VLGTILQWDGSAWIASSFVFPTSIVVGDIGKVLTVSAAGVASFSAAPVVGGTKRYHYAWGANTLSTGNNFPMPFFTAGVSAQRSELIVPFAGNIQKMYISHGTPTGADNLVYTVLKNNVATALTATVSSGASGGSDLVNTVAVVAGDALALRVTGNTLVGRVVTTRVGFYLQ
jgi:hypothetical protein